MTTVYDLVKERRVYSIDADKTVLEAARFMMEHSIGALPVLRNGELVGIFSERDVMNRVVAAGRTPGTTRIAEVMTSNPRGVDAGETVEECLFLMKEFGFRHLPIPGRRTTTRPDAGGSRHYWPRCLWLCCLDRWRCCI